MLPENRGTPHLYAFLIHGFRAEINRYGVPRNPYGRHRTISGNPTIQSYSGGVDRGVGLLGNPYFFTGRRYDEETKLHYYRNRYYDAERGRFISRDPLGYKDGLLLYQYCHGNPVELSDPLGTFSVSPKAIWQGIAEAVSSIRELLTNALEMLRKDAVRSLTRAKNQVSRIKPKWSEQIRMVSREHGIYKGEAALKVFAKLKGCDLSTGVEFGFTHRIKFDIGRYICLGMLAIGVPLPPIIVNNMHAIGRVTILASGGETFVLFNPSEHKSFGAVNPSFAIRPQK